MAIRVHQLRKEYKNACKRGHYTAVRNLSFGIENGECFALLGVNGAGKSTTFKVLMNQIDSTSGEITVDSYDVKTQST